MSATATMTTATTSKLMPRLTISDAAMESEVFAVRFAPEGKYLAAACGDGAIRVFSTDNGTLAFNLEGGSNLSLPTMALKFRPPDATNSRTKNVFLSANAAGTVQHWHMTSSKCLHSLNDDKNQVFCLDYNADGGQFVTAGKDKVLRLYDEATKSLVLEMQASLFGMNEITGHSNRIFSSRFVHDDQNVVLTGGWDNTVLFWDIRTGSVVRSFYGPHICGDAIDIHGNEIVTGSWRPENQLELWDYTTAKKITTIPWEESLPTRTSPTKGLSISNKESTSKLPLIGSGLSSSGKAKPLLSMSSKENSVKNNLGSTGNTGKGSVAQEIGIATSPCMLYAAQFSPNGRFICAGGSGKNEAKLFDRNHQFALVGTVTSLTRGIFTVDFSPDGQQIAIGGGDGVIRILYLAQ